MIAPDEEITAILSEADLQKMQDLSRELGEPMSVHALTLLKQILDEPIRDLDQYAIVSPIDGSSCFNVWAMSPQKETAKMRADEVLLARQAAGQPLPSAEPIALRLTIRSLIHARSGRCRCVRHDR